MLSTIRDAILKRLHIIYGHLLIHNQWPVALMGGDCQGKHRRTFGRQSCPCHFLPKVSGLKDSAKEKPRNFITALKKLYPDREHPPPLVRR
ncbi:MAG: hypothetical protein K0R76_109 [Alphaproteobacteria bacterium]|nr:hypothetical protein [Alphaproteobacteria bacterium]